VNFLEKYQKLLDYQAVDVELFNIENLLKTSKNREKLLKTRNVLLDGQKNAQEFEEEISKYDEQIKTNVKEYNDMKTDIQSLINASTGIDESDLDTIVDLKTKANDINNALKSIQSNTTAILNKAVDIEKKYYNLLVELKKVKTEYNAAKDAHQAEKDKYSKEIEQLKEKLGKLSPGVNEDLLKLYSRKRKNCLPVVVEIKDEQCMGCFMKLPSLVVDSIKGGDDIVECENCGRIIYVVN